MGNTMSETTTSSIQNEISSKTLLISEDITSSLTYTDNTNNFEEIDLILNVCVFIFKYQ